MSHHFLYNYSSQSFFDPVPYAIFYRKKFRSRPPIPRAYILYGWPLKNKNVKSIVSLTFCIIIIVGHIL